jgi:hypothetical protein
LRPGKAVHKCEALKERYINGGQGAKQMSPPTYESLKQNRSEGNYQGALNEIEVALVKGFVSTECVSRENLYENTVIHRLFAISGKCSKPGLQGGQLFRPC